MAQDVSGSERKSLWRVSNVGFLQDGCGGRRIIDVTMSGIAEAMERILDVLEKIDSNMRPTPRS
jgi:hypothetical protein